MTMQLLPSSICAGFLLASATLASRATQDTIHPQLSAETSINPGAGRGDQLVAIFRLADGEQLPVIVDTGASCGVILDKSLEPKLGKRLGTRKVVWPSGKTIGDIYQAPALYLGDTRLLTGSRVATIDMGRFRVGTPVMGLVGLGCLRHYCVQLDFTARKMRLLDPDHPGGGELGKAFPLSTFFISLRRLFAVHENLVGAKDAVSVIDTGCNFDGVLTPKLFQSWTNQWPVSPATTGRRTSFPNGVLGGNSYTNLYLTGDGRFNSLGQLFQARHLVTMNFPKRTMYLQQLSTGSLAEGGDFFDDFYPRDLRKK
jgi:hypothetical protein